LVPQELVSERPALGVAHRDGVAFRDHLLHRQLHREPLVYLSPDGDDLVQFTPTQNSVDERVGREELLERLHVPSVERLDVSPDDFLVRLLRARDCQHEVYTLSFG
jgi:hypothetical protein